MSSNDQNKITATLSLTKDQWEYMASHVMNDLSKGGDEMMLDATKDYMIDLINPELLDFNSK